MLQVQHLGEDESKGGAGPAVSLLVSAASISNASMSTLRLPVRCAGDGTSDESGGGSASTTGLGTQSLASSMSSKAEGKKKIEAINAYSKEIKKYPHPRSIKSIESLAIKRGSEVNLKKAEAFYIVRKVWK